jgi:hypothetical protein
MSRDAETKTLKGLFMTSCGGGRSGRGFDSAGEWRGESLRCETAFTEAFDGEIGSLRFVEPEPSRPVKDRSGLLQRQMLASFSFSTLHCAALTCVCVFHADWAQRDSRTRSCDSAKKRESAENKL